MPRPKLSRRRAALIVAAVFLAGSGIGVAIVVASRSGGSSSAPRASAPTGTSMSGPPASIPPPRVPRRRPAPAPPPATALVPGSAEASFATLEQGLSGSVGLAAAPLGGGATVRFGPAQIARAWSTSKVPVLVTLLRDYAARGQSFPGPDRANAALALEQSDNAAIEALFAELERIHGGLVPASRAVQAVLRRAGDQTTEINTAPNDMGLTTYGQTEWSLSGEVTFYRALAGGCLLGPADTDYVLGLMRSVIASQRWGAGSAGYSSGVSLAFKGGWGPENGRYQVRQTAIVESGGRGYVMAMLALPGSGSFDDGTTLLTTLAGWARRHLNLDAAPGGHVC